MNYTIKNEKLTATFRTLGAELRSLKGASGIEYLWQGAEGYWGGCAPLLFPICGRLCEGKYTYRGKEYEMRLHGFARRTEFEVVSHRESEIVFALHESEATLAQYPFRFTLEVIYRLAGDRLTTTLRVTAEDEKPLIFTVGAHPGFNVPRQTGEAYEDYYVEFGDGAPRYNLTFSENGLYTGIRTPLAMEGGRRIPLRHDLFDNDALFLEGEIPFARDGVHEVSLKSKTNPTALTVRYEDMARVGLWKDNKTTAPFLCIEPWYGIPAYEGKVDDLETKEQMIHLEKGAVYEASFSIQITE